MTKKAVITIGVILVLGVAVFVSANLDLVNVKDSEQEEALRHAGEITGSIKVGQTFESMYPKLSAAGVKMANFSNRKNTKDVIFHLKEGIDAKEDIRKVKVNASKIRDNQFHIFSFKEIPDSAGKTFFFYIESPDSVAGDAVTVRYTNEDVYKKVDGAMYLIRSDDLSPEIIEKSRKKGDLAFQTFHREKPRVVLASYIRYLREQKKERLFYLGRFLAWAIVFAFLVFLVSLLRTNRPWLNSLAVLLIAGVGFWIRLAYVDNMPLTNDEGAYLYDALHVTRGLAPFRDFLTKAPFAIYAYSLGVLYFGNTIFAGRVIAAFAGAATACVLYLIGREIGSKKVGFIAASLYALAPIAVVSTIYVHTQPIQIFIVSIAVYLLTYALNRKKPGVLFWHGLFLGLALPFRNSAWALGLVPLLGILILTRDEFKKKIQYFFLTGLGFILAFGGYFAYSYITLGLDRTLYIVGLETAKTSIKDLPNHLEEDYINYSTRGVSPVFREGGLLIFLVLLFIYFVLFLRTKFSPLVSRIFGIIPLGLFWFLTRFYFKYENKFHFWSKPLWWVFGILIVLLVIFSKNLRLKEKRFRMPELVPVFWFLGLSIFYLLWIKFHSNYIIEFIPPLSLMAALGLNWMLKVFKKQKKRVLKIAFLTVAIFVFVWSTFISYFMTYTFEHTGTFDIKAVKEAAGYLRENVPKDQEIFTAAAIIPYLSNHKIVLNVSHPTWYAYGFIGTERRDLFMPKIEDLVTHVQSNQINWFIREKLTTMSYFLNYEEEIENYITENFEEVKSIENLENEITIWKRKKLPQAEEGE